MSPPSQSRSQTAPPPDASTPRLRSPKLPARVNPCCTACPSHPPDSVAKMESAFASLENPLRLAFLGMCSRRFPERHSSAEHVAGKGVVPAFRFTRSTAAHLGAFVHFTDRRMHGSDRPGER